MSVRKKGDRYEVRYDTYDAKGSRSQHRRIFDKSRDANAFDAEMKTRAGELVDPNAGKITVYEWLQKWLDVYVKPHMRPRTYERYKYNIESLVAPRLEGAVKLSKVRRPYIQDLLNRLSSDECTGKKVGQVKKKYSKNTVDSVRRTLHAAFNQAILDGYIKDNPAGLCKSGGRKAVEPVVLSSDQVLQFLSAIKNTDFYLPVFLASSLGLCRGEVAGLKWSDVDFEAGTVSIVRSLGVVEHQGVQEGLTKTKSRRRVLPMPSFVSLELHRQKKLQAQMQLKYGADYIHCDYVCRHENGDYYRPTSYSLAMKTYIERYNLTPMRFHDLRHTCLSLLLDRGVPLPIVAEIAGHSSTHITAQVYSHSIKSSKHIAADTLDQIYGAK